MTIWHTVAIISLAVIALASMAVFACVLGTLRGRGWPATPPAPRCPPSAAPGHTHDSGGLESVTKRWVCGCRHHYDGAMRLVAVEAGECRSGDWDAALKGLTS